MKIHTSRWNALNRLHEPSNEREWFPLTRVPNTDNFRIDTSRADHIRAAPRNTDPTARELYRAIPSHAPSHEPRAVGTRLNITYKLQSTNGQLNLEVRSSLSERPFVN